MSYDFFLMIEEGVPAEDDRAWDRFRSLTNNRDVIPEGFIDFWLFHAVDGICGCQPLGDFPENDPDRDLFEDDCRLLKCTEVGSAFLHATLMTYTDRALNACVSAADLHDLVLLDPETGLVHRPHGFRGVKLSGDFDGEITRPDAFQIEEKIDEMNDGGPGFVIVDRGRNYAQAAGRNNEFAVEWRCYEGASFRHFAAGYQENPTAAEVPIPTNDGYVVRVRSNERLTAMDVKFILLAFAKNCSPPPQFKWRDMTDEFL